MAQVPLLRPSEDIQSYNPVYQNASAPLGAFGRGDTAAQQQFINGKAAERFGANVENLGTTGLEILTKEQIEDNEKSAKDADIAFADAIRNVGYGDDGLYAKQGDHATAAVPKAKLDIEDARNKILATLPTQKARDMFSQVAAMRQGQEYESISRFGSKEREVGLDDTSTSRINTFGADAIARYNDKKAIEQNLMGISSELASMADRKGKSADWLKAQIEGARGKVLTGVIAAAGENNYGQAKQIYDQYKDSIPGDDRLKIEQNLAENQRAEMAKQEHAVIMAEHARNLQQDKNSDALFTKMADKTLTVDDIKHTDLDFGKKMTFYNELVQQSKDGDKIETDGNVFSTIWKLAGMQPNDPNRPSNKDLRQLADDAVGRRQLTVASRNDLISFIDGSGTPEAKQVSDLTNNLFKTVTQSLSGANDMTGLRDPNGQLQVSKFMSVALQALKDKPTAEQVQLLDANNPKSLYSLIPSYKRSPTEFMKDLIDDNPGNPSAFSAGVVVPSSSSGSVPDLPTNATAAAVPTITSQTEYDKLESGAMYKDASGKTKRKP